MLFFILVPPDQGREFFGRFWPEARVVSDPSAEIYQSMGIGRGGLAAFLSPGVITAGLRSLGKGNAAGRPVGDPFVMPGLFLVRGPEVLWSHRYRHIGDHPDYRALAGRVQADAG